MLITLRNLSEKPLEIKGGVDNGNKKVNDDCGLLAQEDDNGYDIDQHGGNERQKEGGVQFVVPEEHQSSGKRVHISEAL